MVVCAAAVNAGATYAVAVYAAAIISARTAAWWQREAVHLLLLRRSTLQIEPVCVCLCCCISAVAVATSMAVVARVPLRLFVLRWFRPDAMLVELTPLLSLL
mmetsp:Transcript_139323/g.277861  ORF Transcript_139323/g.277861 Transcript_139323/m.277861 type:complete len:102 (+) Transcript_139323:970-1275(+)